MPSFHPPQLGPALRRLPLLLVAMAGAGVSALMLGLIWPEADRSEEPLRDPTPADLGVKPRRAITVLLIGSDADTVGGDGAAPRGSANSDALVLLRVNPRGPLQALALPVELGVNVPGQERPRPLGSLYRSGGVALTADAVRELLGLGRGQPDRYVVLPRGSLRELVERLGGVEVNPPRKMQYRDRSQKLNIQLQGGLQVVKGQGLEHMLRFRDRWLGEGQRRLHQQLALTSVRDQMGRREQLASLPRLVADLHGKVETDLSQTEMLGLLAAGLDDDQPIQFRSLPLDPPRKDQGGMRQLSASARPPLFPAP
ncbi:MAG: LCP family protein [Synechococcaceae cyanobacterium]|jgi:LCP family protein required for cell wall assembly